MPKVQVDLGGRAYLWKEAGGYAPNVVISAHGIYRPNTATFQAGAPTLYFYCPHDGTVDDVPQATGVKNTPPTETIPDGNDVNCWDYTLFKYQEHSADIRAFAKAHQMTFAEAERRSC